MLYKPMIDDSKKVGFYKISFYSQWGTPEDFNEYKNWSEKFLKIQKFKKKKKKREYKNGVVEKMNEFMRI